MTPIPLPVDLMDTRAAMLTLLDEIEEIFRAEQVSLRSEGWHDLDSTRCALTNKHTTQKAGH